MQAVAFKAACTLFVGLAFITIGMCEDAASGTPPCLDCNANCLSIRQGITPGNFYPPYKDSDDPDDGGDMLMYFDTDQGINAITYLGTNDHLYDNTYLTLEAQGDANNPGCFLFSLVDTNDPQKREQFALLSVNASRASTCKKKFHLPFETMKTMHWWTLSKTPCDHGIP